MFRSACYTILLLLGCTRLCVAQQKENNFINITQQDGLPSNETYCVFKDSKDYIWIATDRGVVRHKGSSMQLFNNLPDNVVFKIREDGKGRVWFFSYSGKLAYFYNERVYPFPRNDSIIKHIDRFLINDAYVNDKDEIFLNSQTVGHNFKIARDGKIVVDYDSYSSWQFDSSVISINNTGNSGLETHFINPFCDCKYKFLKIIRNDLLEPLTYNIPIVHLAVKQCGIIKLKNNAVLFWGSNSLIKLEEDGTYEIKNFSEKILSVFNDTINNKIIIGQLNGGITNLNEKLEITDTGILPKHSVSSIMIDNEGELWLTTLDNGIYYSANSNRYKSFFSLFSSQPVERIVNIADSFLLMANINGIFKLNGNSLSTILKEKNQSVGDLQLNKQKDLFFVRVNDFDYKSYLRTSNYPFLRNIISTPSSHEIIVLQNGTAWINYYSDLGRIVLHPKATRKQQDIPTETMTQMKELKVGAILEKDSSNFFFAGKKQLGIYNLTGNYFHELVDTAGIFSSGVTCMRQMANGLYVIGTKFGGMAIVKDTVVVGVITASQGLNDNSIKYILPLKDMLWVVNSRGISVIQFSSYAPLIYTVKNFGNDIGLTNTIIYQLVPFKDKILVATNKGIYAFNNVEELLKQQLPAIPLYITTINTYKGDTSGINNIALPFSHNRLSVSFDAICYNTPKELKYNYRLLDGEDTSWQNLGGTQVILENLAPGQYELQVKASIPSQGRTSAVQTLSILILKPWWQLNWVRAAVVLLFLAIVFLVYKWRVGLIQQRESEKTLLKTQMAELEQTALRSQMNPHFIFNCLTSIQQLVLTGNRLEANEYLVKFSRLIRKTLELSAVPYTSIENEKNYLAEYIELEQLRMPGKFDFTFTIEEYIDVFKTELPNMMLQPIIENAIRHGVKHLQDRTGLINIEIAMQDDCLKCTVTDNGIGRKKAGATHYFTPHKSYGMDIVRKRLTGLPGYDGKNYFIEIIDLVDEENNAAGTKVIVLLPFKIEYN